MQITIPPHPGPEPTGETATAAGWDLYLRRLTLHQAAVLAQVKHEDESACVAAQHAMADAVRVQGKFTEFVFPKRTREELIFELIKSYPQNTRATELQIAKNCEMQVNAYLEVCPAALAPADPL